MINIRILILSTTDLKKAAYSRPHHIIKYLSKSHEVTAICMNAWWLVDENNNPLYDHNFNDNVKLIYLTNLKVNPGLQEIIFLTKIKKYTSKIHNNFDVCILFDSIFSGYFLANRIKKNGVPIVFDIDDDIPEMVKTSLSISYSLRYIGWFISKILLRKIIKISDKITFTLDTLKEIYEIPVDKSQCVPNGVDTHLFDCNYSSNKLKEELGLKINYFIIGYVGVLQEWVDLDPVFIALKSIDDPIKMLIVGEEGKLKENQELVKNYGISDKVIFIGTIEYNQVPQYIALMDVCLVPFKINFITENALPLKLFEYMACKKPVISTPLSGVKKTVGNNILYASNPEEFKQHVLNLCFDVKLRKKYGEVNRQFVEKNFEWIKICEEFEELLIKVASSNNKVNQ